MIVIVAVVVALGAAITAWATGGVASAGIAVTLALGVIAAIVVHAVRGRWSSGAATSAEAVATSDTGDTVEEPVGEARPAEPTDVEEPTAVEQEEATDAAPAGPAPAAGPEPEVGTDDEPIASGTGLPSGTEPSHPVLPSGVGTVGVADVVYVLPGRRRFHRAGCELIVDRKTDDIALDDARDEGFSACSVCHGLTARH